MTYDVFYLLMVCLVLIAVAGCLSIFFFLDATQPVQLPQPLSVYYVWEGFAE